MRWLNRCSVKTIRVFFTLIALYSLAVGTIRNCNAVSTDALQHTVIDSLRSFRGNAEQNDDVTVVVVKAL
jgi:hypothetical protein